MSIDKTMVQVTKQTRKRLIDLGTYRETYDDIINRLIDFYAARGEVAT